jgi:cytochrome c oxidase subunit III
MNAETHTRPVLDVSHLPTVVFGQRSILWWATASLAAIEGTMFVIVMVAYYYLRTRTSDWPSGVFVPALTFGSINLVIYLASLAPNHWIKKMASAGKLKQVRIGLVIMSLIAVLTVGIRIFEFPALNCRWDSNAYASVVWLILGLHTAHLVTDTIDTIVLTVLMFNRHKIDGTRFMDTAENADYWYFVVFSWIPLYLTIYIAPRLI